MLDHYLDILILKAMDGEKKKHSIQVEQRHAVEKSHSDKSPTWFDLYLETEQITIESHIRFVELVMLNVTFIKQHMFEFQCIS